MAKDLTRLEGALHDLKKYNDIIKDIEARRDHVKEIIIAELGDDVAGEIDGATVVTYKWQSTKTIDTKALKEAHPELVAKYQRVSEHRRFVIVTPESVEQ